MDIGLITLCETISAWVDMELEKGNTVPDFWDENSTSERLSEFLWANGWRKQS